jgi:hypothetical protein
MHPSQIKTLPKKPFCCAKCDKSFDHATTLSKHKLEHKKEEEGARQQLNNKIKELQELIDRTNRERQLELRNVALEKVVSESQQEIERLSTMFYKLRSRKIDFIPINSVSHIDTIDKPLYKLIMHHGEEGLSKFVSHVFFNKNHLDRQSLSVCKDDDGVIHCQRYDGKNGPEFVSSSELMNEILLSFCSTMTTCMSKYSAPRNELSHGYQEQEKLKRFINDLEALPIHRSMISSRLLVECLNSSSGIKLRPTIQY